MKLEWFSACPACPKTWVLLPPALYNALRTAFRNLTEKNQEFKVPQPHRNFKANMSYRRLSFQKEEKGEEGRERTLRLFFYESHSVVICYSHKGPDSNTFC